MTVLGAELPVPILLLIGALVLLLYPYLLVVLWREFRSEYRSLAVPKGAPGAPSIFQGIPRATRLLAAPLSGKPCIAWQLHCYYHNQMRAARLPSNEDADSAVFELDGRALDLGGSLQFPKHLPHRQKLRIITGQPVGGEVGARLAPLRSYQAIHEQEHVSAYDLREYRLDPETPCTVVGSARVGEEPPIRVEGACVAPGSYMEATRGLRRALVWHGARSALGLFLVPLGILVFFMILGRYG